MTGSALDEFVSASRALSQFARRVSSTGPDAPAPVPPALRERFPEAFMDFQEGSVGGHAARTKAILRASTRIAVHLSAALNSHAHEQYRQGHFRNAFRGFGLVLVINPASPTATVLHASSLISRIPGPIS